MIPTGIIVVGSLKIQGPLCCVWHGMATAAQAEETKGGTVEDKPLGLEGMIRPRTGHYPGFG